MKMWHFAVALDEERRREFEELLVLTNFDPVMAQALQRQMHYEY